MLGGSGDFDDSRAVLIKRQQASAVHVEEMILLGSFDWDEKALTDFNLLRTRRSGAPLRKVSLVH